jgi:hypothetical protein
MKQQQQSHTFLISLPERAGRALIALGGGAVAEAANHLLPRALRRSRLYEASIGRLLRIVVEGVGGVEPTGGAAALPLEQLMLRKAAGNAAELAAFAAVGWSPIWLLAATADIVGGTRHYLTVLVDGLISEGVLKPGTRIDEFADLLAALEGGSGALADAIDLPPTTAAELRSSWQQLAAQRERLPSPAQLADVFTQLTAAAQQEQRSLFDVSGLVAAAALRSGVALGQAELFASYGPILSAIQRDGIGRYLQQLAVPYLVGAAQHFDSSRPSWTERGAAWISRWWAQRRGG